MVSSTVVTPLVVGTLITPTVVSSPVMVLPSVPSSITTPFTTNLITTTSPETWSKPAKLQSQTTFSGKENENVVD